LREDFLLINSRLSDPPADLQISWPPMPSGFGLEEITDLNPSSAVGWTPVPFPYQTNATSVSVTLPLGAQNRFYRLRKP
jgi:hypothetical protein